MISRFVFALTTAVLYIKNHPQILFALILLIVFPILFLYTGQQFLDVGKANQDRLQKDRVGLMHDTVTSLLRATQFNQHIAQTEFSRIAELNPDIIDYEVAKQEGGLIIPFVAKNQQVIGIEVQDPSLYINASLRTDESLIFEFYENDARLWATYRAVQAEDGGVYFIYTLVSLESVDQLFTSREQKAYFSLVFVYCFVIALAYWHIRLTDYRYLYIKAQKANEMKDLFTNMIAHELRAPLTAIRGYASLLEERITENEEHTQAGRIRESAERLLAIVNDLLDVARIQSGKLTVVKEEIELSKIICDVVHELEVSAQEKEITLSLEGVQNPHTVMMDAKRIYQALTNLVSNAIKYTSKGTITIAIEEKLSFVEIRVKDTGMGIGADDQKKLFAPFFRAVQQDVSKITGTGLGMWITKELIELMGAQIGVESIKGVGTHVVITIPKEIRIS